MCCVVARCDSNFDRFIDQAENVHALDCIRCDSRAMSTKLCTIARAALGEAVIVIAFVAYVLGVMRMDG